MAKRASDGEEPEAKRALVIPDEPLSAEYLLKNLKLKRILKENHGSEIKAVAFNRIKPENFNLVATIADTQASIYDNANCGEHLDIMLHFVNVPMPGALKRDRCDLTSLAWLSPTDEPHDAFLAVGSADTFIHIISIARCGVIRVLQGHTDTVTSLASSASAPNFLLSAAKDKVVRMWHVSSGDCVAYLDCHVSSLAWAADGRRFYSGSSHGALKQWDLSTVLDNLENAHRSAIVLEQSASTAIAKHHTQDIDYIKSLKNSVLSKSIDGSIVVWDPISGNVERKLKVKGLAESASTCDVSTDERFVVAGNGQGALFVWNLQTGDQVTRLEYRRKESRAPVRACAIAEDLKSIVYATNGPYIWRWDYIDPEAIKNYQKRREQE